MTSPSRVVLDAAVAHVALQVTRENVLAVRDTIRNKAEQLDAELTLQWQAATTMPELAGDPISADAATAFPALAEALLRRCQQYVHDLEDAAAALDETARSYGLTESEIAGTMLDAAASPAIPPAAAPSAVPVVGPTIDQNLNPHLYGGG